MFPSLENIKRRSLDRNFHQQHSRSTILHPTNSSTRFPSSKPSRSSFHSRRTLKQFTLSRTRCREILDNNKEAQKKFGTPEFLKIFQGMENERNERRIEEIISISSDGFVDPFDHSQSVAAATTSPNSNPPSMLFLKTKNTTLKKFEISSSPRRISSSTLKPRILLSSFSFTRSVESALLTPRRSRRHPLSSNERSSRSHHQQHRASRDSVSTFGV